MSESLWSASADELLRRTASSAPTPGGGSIAAVSGALGIGLMLMAIEVTGEPDDPAARARLAEHRATLDAALERVRAAVDGDVEVFEAVMAAYRLPKDDPSRSTRVHDTTIDAAIAPLEAAGALAGLGEIVAELGSLVKPSIRSDVVAGAHLAAAAANALVETSRINRHALDRMGEDATAAFERRAGDLAALEPTEVHWP